MISDEMNVLRTLKLARALCSSYDNWRKWTHRENRNEGTVYWFVEQGWLANDYQGPFWPAIKAIRPHVEGEDLTWWWQHGRSRYQMLKLFDAAIAELEKKAA